MILASMDLSAGSLFASLVISTIGGGFFLYGKKQQRLPQLFTGLVLGVYPYFVGNVAWMIVIAAALIGGLWLAVRAGW
jgi:hypothetical protein